MKLHVLRRLCRELDGGAVFILVGCLATLWWLAMRGGVPALSSSVGLVSLAVAALAAGHVRKRRPAVTRSLGVAIILGSLLCAAPPADAAVPTTAPSPAPLLILPHQPILSLSGAAHGVSLGAIPPASPLDMVTGMLSVLALWSLIGLGIWWLCSRIYGALADGVAERVAARVRRELERQRRPVYPAPADEIELPTIEAYEPEPGEIIEE